MSAPVPHAGASPEARPPRPEECEGCRRGLPINSHGRHWYRTASLANGVVELPHTAAPVSARVPLSEAEPRDSSLLDALELAATNYSQDWHAYHAGKGRWANAEKSRDEWTQARGAIAERIASLRTALASARSALDAKDAELDEVHRKVRNVELAATIALKNEKEAGKKAVGLWQAALAGNVEELNRSAEIIRSLQSALSEAKRRAEDIREIARPFVDALSDSIAHQALRAIFARAALPEETR